VPADRMDASPEGLNSRRSFTCLFQTRFSSFARSIPCSLSQTALRPARRGRGHLLFVRVRSAGRTATVFRKRPHPPHAPCLTPSPCILLAQKVSSVSRTVCLTLVCLSLSSTGARYRRHAIRYNSPSTTGINPGPMVLAGLVVSVVLLGKVVVVDDVAGEGDDGDPEAGEEVAEPAKRERQQGRVSRLRPEGRVANARPGQRGTEV
jgi:hypothetical protein